MKYARAPYTTTHTNALFTFGSTSIDCVGLGIEVKKKEKKIIRISHKKSHN